MTSLLRWAALVSVLGVACAASATDTAALAKRLHNAADASSLDDPALKPWHLKLAVQLYDAKGNASEQGTIEEWWNAGQDKRIYQAPSYSSTEIRNSKGLFRTTNRPTAPYLLDAARERVVHPMATPEEIDGAKPDLRTETFGKVKLDCIMLDQPIKNVAYPPMGLFPTYCLDQNRDLLRLSYRFGSESAIFNKMGTFQGRTVSLDTVIFQDNAKAVSAQVVTLDSKDFDSTIFAVSDELTQHQGLPTLVSAGVMAGHILVKVTPIFPEEAKIKHISGAVHLSALIGTDGHIHRLRIIDTPDPSLAISALAAVRKWTYAPFLLKDAPVEVETTIIVNYNFGPG